MIKVVIETGHVVWVSIWTYVQDQNLGGLGNVYGLLLGCWGKDDFSDWVNRKWTYTHLDSGFAQIFGQIISIRVKDTKQIKPIQGILKYALTLLNLYWLDLLSIF